MDALDKQMLKELFEQSDLNDVRTDAWQAKHAPLQKRETNRRDLVFKVHDGAQLEHEYLDAATQAKWDRWRDARILAHCEMTAEEIGTATWPVIEKLEMQVAALQGEVEILRPAMLGRITKSQLKKYFSERGGNAA